MIRYVEADDIAVVASEILARSMTREAISPTRFTRQVLLDPNFRREGSFLALDGDTPVGYGLAVIRHVPVEGVIPDPDRGYLWLLGVIPEARNQGVGQELLDRAEAYIRKEGKKLCLASPYSPGYFQPGVDVDAYAEGLRFLLARGYREVYRPIAMETSLWDLNIPDWTEGVQIERTGSLKLLEFARETFGPDWARFVRDSMTRQLDADGRTGLAVATQNGQILGFGHFDGERFGPIGVAETERGRGLGHLLMWDILAQQRERGCRVSWFLWSDDRTADRLYRHAGFREARRFALLKKELG